MIEITQEIVAETATAINAREIAFLATPRLQSCNPLRELDSGCLFVSSLQAKLQTV